MLYIFAIGNPGIEYEKTRHNAGRIAGAFLKDHNSLDFPYQYIETDTYMNTSGNFINKFLKNTNFNKEIDRFVVIYDDKDIELGEIKNGYDRGHGGHNGIRNIIDNFGKGFYRIRIGIGDNRKGGILSYFKKDNNKQDIADYVLERFKKSELEILRSEEMKIKIKDSLTLIHKEILSKRKED